MRRDDRRGRGRRRSADIAYRAGGGAQGPAVAIGAQEVVDGGSRPIGSAGERRRTRRAPLPASDARRGSSRGGGGVAWTVARARSVAGDGTRASNGGQRRQRWRIWRRRRLRRGRDGAHRRGQRRAMVAPAAR
ncbi:hypothetical protein Syun_018872 [Stephania yunnanensis]|uniref:Uncharacterized protein n=1 Tax=Stephania yunnanensis TaxID=152371 RepID=A0AAP0NXE9_9MAGN